MPSENACLIPGLETFCIVSVAARGQHTLVCRSFMKLHWRFGIVAGIFLAVFSLYPQFKLLYLRGNEWNGHYAYNDIDEVAYASYVRALIDGRPRKNDPYSGRDDTPDAPQQESLFSIQFAAPYSIALPARVFGVGTPWAMTLSGAVAGFPYPYFPGFRRYIPAMAMAAVFGLFAAVWRLIGIAERRTRNAESLSSTYEVSAQDVESSDTNSASRVPHSAFLVAAVLAF